jgi:hypothetical protein
MIDELHVHARQEDILAAGADEQPNGATSGSCGQVALGRTTAFTRGGLMDVRRLTNGALASVAPIMVSTPSSSAQADVERDGGKTRRASSSNDPQRMDIMTSSLARCDESHSNDDHTRSVHDDRGASRRGCDVRLS